MKKEKGISMVVLILIIMLLLVITTTIAIICVDTINKKNESKIVNQINKEMQENTPEEWKKININNCSFYDDCTINIDLNGDTYEEIIEIKSYGKYIIINEKEYVANKRAQNEGINDTNDNEIISLSDNYNVNQYHIVDLNNDNIMEIIHRTFSDMISPITSYYTIYNFYDNELYQVGEMSFIGNIPNEIYVKGNTLKFEYWPYELPENYKEEIVIELQLNYLIANNELNEVTVEKNETNEIIYEDTENKINENSKLLVVNTYLNRAWLTQFQGTAIFDDGSIYTWTENDNSNIIGYNLETVEDLEKYISSEATLKSTSVSDSDLKQIKEYISKIEDNINITYPGADQGVTTISVIDNNNNEIVLKKSGDRVGENKTKEAQELLKLIQKYF